MVGQYVREPAREVPVSHDVEVVVVGGGTAGGVAAIAAARAGATTLLVERYGRVGGFFSWGWVTKPQGAIVGGIPGELFDRVIAYGGAIPVPASWQPRLIRRKYIMSPTDPMTVERVYLELLDEAGVTLLLNALAVDAVVDEDAVTGVIVETKAGRRALLARAVVDATGDGDVAARAGVPFEVGRIRPHRIETYPYRADGLTETMSLMFRMGDVDLVQYVDYQHHAKTSSLPDLLDDPAGFRYAVYGGVTPTAFLDAPEVAVQFPKPRVAIKTGRGLHEVFVNATSVSGVTIDDDAAVSRAEVALRRQVLAIADFLRAHVPGFAEAYVIDTTITIQPRETRRFVGEYMLTEADIRSGHRFPDTVARVFAGVDISQPDGPGSYNVQFPEYDIPYRCLLPQRIDHLLLAGRAISADHYAHGSTRGIAVCLYTGQAAGAAAALAACRATTPRRLPIAALQEMLHGWGTFLFDSVFARIQAQYPDVDLRAADIGCDERSGWLAPEAPRGDAETL